MASCKKKPLPVLDLPSHKYNSPSLVDDAYGLNILLVTLDGAPDHFNKIGMHPFMVKKNFIKLLCDNNIDLKGEIMAKCAPY